jgi:hypothetical protein
MIGVESSDIWFIFNRGWLNADMPLPLFARQVHRLSSDSAGTKSPSGSGSNISYQVCPDTFGFCDKTLST